MPEMPHRQRRVLGLFLVSVFIAAVHTEESRPYEFSFNIEDFQHRYEKRDSAGIVTGEYGFITADGVYHETAYATDENGNFIITKMKNRKITSLQVAEEIFKGKPEVAKRVIEVLAKSCSGCGIPVEKPPGLVDSGSLVARLGNAHEQQSRLGFVENEQATASRNVNNEQETSAASKSSIEQVVPKIPEPLDNEIDRNAPNDFHYRFDYNISSHGHRETGYRDGNKDGAYRTLGPNGTDTNVQYLSNEFGHQPNITYVNRPDNPHGKDSFSGFVFKWIYQER